jgi:hypothetical protein
MVEHGFAKRAAFDGIFLHRAATKEYRERKDRAKEKGKFVLCFQHWEPP